ncbi:hypothetical protein DFH09DRAFT_1458976 [Mycena vulgaris]|nr:hypothetical protein DFH09DRAFT_1458976 [Mycena vulgaris]
MNNTATCKRKRMSCPSRGTRVVEGRAERSCTGRSCCSSTATLTASSLSLARARGKTVVNPPTKPPAQSRTTTGDEQIRDRETRCPAQRRRGCPGQVEVDPQLILIAATTPDSDRKGESAGSTAASTHRARVQKDATDKREAGKAGRHIGQAVVGGRSGSRRLWETSKWGERAPVAEKSRGSRKRASLIVRCVRASSLPGGEAAPASGPPGRSQKMRCIGWREPPSLPNIFWLGVGHGEKETGGDGCIVSNGGVGAGETREGGPDRRWETREGGAGRLHDRRRCRLLSRMRDDVFTRPRTRMLERRGYNDCTEGSVHGPCGCESRRAE